ncbi:MAG: pitrilysin family protein, partial [Bacteriovoracaceae bacterium]
NLAKIEKLFISTLKEAVVKGITEEELVKIKNQYISSKVYERESIESFSFSLGHGFAQSGNIYCEDAFIERIHNTTLDEVKTALVEILKKSSHFNLQVPKGQIKPQIEKTLKTWQKNISVLSKTKIKTQKNSLITSEFDPAVKVTEIKPGIKFIYRQNKLTPTFVLHAYLKGGQSAETARTAGAHHLLSRLISYGYQGCKYEKLKSELEFVSSYLTGFSGKNAYGVTLHGQSKDFGMLTNHFFGTLKKPEFPKKFFEHERKIILRAIDNQKEDPMKQAFKKYYSFVFKDHPYSLDIAGTPQTLKSFTPTSFVRLHSYNLKKSEIVFTYSGDQDYHSVLKMITEMTKDLPARTPIKKLKKKPNPVVGKSESLHFDREQTQIIIGKPAFPIGKIEDLYLKMITAHLSGQSSDLFVEVRDRQGLCYSVSPIHISALEAGCWGIYIGSGSDKTESAIKAIMNILDDLAENGISKKEFDRIKTMIDGQTLLGIQTNEDYAQVYSIPVLHNLGLDHAHKNNVMIRNAKYEDFQKFLKKFMKGKWNIIKAGKA